ncbi:MAG: tRNA pseudouridine(13) synthase TruD [Deltaproteobacteria bacterium]
MPPRRTAHLAGCGGRLLARPEDFVVEETIPYALSGEGTHLFVRIEKTALTTPQAVGRLLPGIDRRRIGWAGLKDRHAIARQWISIDDPRGELTVADVDGVRVLETTRHKNKLKRGHVASNTFTIRLREVSAVANAAPIVDALKATGLPNVFGPQRFGRDGDNAERALRILRGEARAPRRRDEKSILMSALQSELFNAYVTLRLERALFDVALDGDVMKKHETGGLFTVDDPTAEQPRVDAMQISPTGPLFGKKTMRAERAARALEDEVLEASGLDEAMLARVGPGTRRLIRIPFDPDATVEAEDEATLRLRFTLPSGAYATVVLDEVVKPDAGTFTREAPEPA